MKLSGVAHRIAVFSSVLLGFQIMLGTISVQTGEAKLTGRKGDNMTGQVFNVCSGYKL